MKKKENKFHTFVVCAYKESPFLEECVRSLLEQEVFSRIVIATSTPNDYIKNIADKYALQLFINDGEAGLAGDWNFAVSCAETPLVTLAHQDDRYAKSYSKAVIESFQKCRHPLIMFTDYYELRGTNLVKDNRLLRIKRLLLSPLKKEKFWNNKFVRRRILSLGSAICCPSVTLVKENLELPVFENNMKSNIDWQAWEKLSWLDGEFAYVSKPLMAHRIHEESTTSELIAEDGRKEEDLYMFCKFWPKWMARLIETFYGQGEKSNTLK